LRRLLNIRTALNVASLTELLGNSCREGVTDAVQPTIVNDHDFTSVGNEHVLFASEVLGEFQSFEAIAGRS